MNQAERYLELVTQAEGKPIDASYQAAFYLLTCEEELFQVARKHVSSRGIAFDSIRQEVVEQEDSHQLAEIACNLFRWGAECSVTPFAISRLGYPLMEQVCTAIFIASGGVQIELDMVQEEILGGIQEELQIVLDDSRYRVQQASHQRMERMWEESVRACQEEAAGEWTMQKWDTQKRNSSR